MSQPRCTFHHVGEPECRRPEDDPIHPAPDERMPHGGHVFRVEHPKSKPAPQARPRRATEYGRGYQAGYHAGIRRTACPA